jgi:hypothetical protein
MHARRTNRVLTVKTPKTGKASRSRAARGDAPVIKKRRLQDMRRSGRSGAPADLERHLKEVALLFSRVFAGFESGSPRPGRRSGWSEPGHARNSTGASHLGYLARVLGRWAEDPRFVTEQGTPRDLAEAGPSLSFASLVAEELPGENATDCLAELLSTGSVVRLSNGLIRWRRRVAISKYPMNILELLRPLRALLMNLESAIAFERAPLATFTRGVSGFEVAEKDVNDLCSLLEHHGMMLLELVDNFLSQRARKNARLRLKRTRIVRPYVGIVMCGDGDMPMGIAQLRRSHTR